MSIQDWGAIGEIIGALAVVASLIYLAVQIRQNTRQISLSLESTKLAAFERNVESGNRTREILITDPDLADLFLRGVSGFVDLRSTEKFRCDMLFRNLFSSLTVCCEKARSSSISAAIRLCPSAEARDCIASNSVLV